MVEYPPQGLQNLTRALVVLVDETSRREGHLWSDPVTALLVRSVLEGQLQRRPFDVSSLSATLRLPMPTVSRRVNQLIEQSILERQRVGRSYRLALTETASARYQALAEAMIPPVRRFMADVTNCL